MILHSLETTHLKMDVRNYKYWNDNLNNVNDGNHDSTIEKRTSCI
jgi:hypothetical protein